MQRSLDTGLGEVKAQLIQMAGYLEEAVKYSTLAWKNRSREMIDKVNQIESKVNQAHMDIDAACFKLLATQQPLASDLRFLLSVVKINTDLERMADQAVNIANNTEFYLKHTPYPDLADLIKMSEIVRELVKVAIDSFINSDSALAKKVVDEDDQVDQLKDKVFQNALESIKMKTTDAEQGLNVILIARNLERIGDHATNIAEDVIFSISGKDVRHSHSREKGGSMKNKVLIVEDERDIADLMALHLKRDGIEVEIAENGEQAFQSLENKSFDLLILDWMLPGISGLDICKKIRQPGSKCEITPILLVTARAQTSDIVLGLEMGADDYITKPFDLSVFIARVRALLRRSVRGVQTETENQIQIGHLVLDTERHEVRCHAGLVDLTPSEFKLLHAMMKNRGRVLTRERLIELVQGEGVAVIDRAIDTHIFGLRKKLGECANLVETIRGVGYRVADTL